MNALHALHFLYPNCLYALLPLGLIVAGLATYRINTAYWQRICDVALLPHVIVNRAHAWTRWPYGCLAVAWCLLVIALAGPTWSKRAVPLLQTGAARVLVLDLSPTMLANDVAPSRLARARYKVLDMLAALHGGQTGLVVFAGEPYVVSPLTSDTQTIAAMVPTLSPDMMPIDGSDLSAALQQAAKLMQQAGVHGGDIIVLSDSAASQSDQATAKQLAQAGFFTSVLSIGDKANTPIQTANGLLRDAQGQLIMAGAHSDSLQALAIAGGGHFVTFTADDSDMSTLLKPVAQTHFSVQQSHALGETDLWRNQGH